MVRKLESVWGAEEHQGLLFPAYQSNCSSLCRSGHKLKWVRVTAFCGMVFNATKSCQRCNCSQISYIHHSSIIILHLLLDPDLQNMGNISPALKAFNPITCQQLRVLRKNMRGWRALLAQIDIRRVMATTADGGFVSRLASRPGSCNSPILVGVYSEIEMNYWHIMIAYDIYWNSYCSSWMFIGYRRYIVHG